MTIKAQTIGLAILALALPVLFAIAPVDKLRQRQLEASPPPNTMLAANGPLEIEPAAEFCHQADRPRTTNVTVLPADSGLVAEQRPQLVYCDAVRNSVGVIQNVDGNWTDRLLVPENSLAAPCHAAATDYDGDGDTDFVVAVLGRVWPSDAWCGQVAILEQQSDRSFVPRIIAEHLRRVADVQPADFDGDGDVDFIVAEFGYKHGGILFLECLPNGTYAKHDLLNVAGTIHVPVADFDADGDLDFAALVSQDMESVLLFENVHNERSEGQNEDGNSASTNGGSGSPVFRRHTAWSTMNFDQGTAGMIVDDLDQDGDPDLIVSAGDNLELQFPYPQPWHGCFWLENTGDLEFKKRPAGNLPGTYAAAVHDMDADGDRDIVLVSMFNDWANAASTSVGWLENDGRQNFTGWHLAAFPTHLCTVAVADFDADGKSEIASGGLHLYPPFDNDPAGLTIWKTSIRNSQTEHSADMP